MDPAIDAARALLPTWVQWANVSVAAPLALVATVLASFVGAAVTAPPSARERSPESLAAARRVMNALCVAVPAVWAASVVASAGPIGRTPMPALVGAVGAASLAGALAVRRAVRRRAPAVPAGWSLRALGGFLAGVAMSVALALSLRLALGQAWSRAAEARVLAVALTGGHDRTLADLAWTAAQSGDQARAAVLLQAALVAEPGVTPAANLAIVFANQGRCVDAARALQEATVRLGRAPSPRDRALAVTASRAVQDCHDAAAVPQPGMTPIPPIGT